MGNDFVIVTDSTTDLTQEFADSLGLVIIPYIFNLDGKEYRNYLDYRELSARDYYDALRAGKTASTSLVTGQRYIDAFTPHVREGKDILYLCLSTGMSSSFGQSKMAAETLEKEFPGRKLIMIDTLAASMGQGMLAYYAAKARGEGKTLEETADYIKGIFLKLCMWVGVDDLNHLRRGGRVSGASAFFGTILNIKPIIHVDDEGRLIPVEKVRGWNNVMDYMVSRMEETLLPPKDQVVFISHSDAQERAEKLANLIVTRLGPREVKINYIGPVIGAHTGPGTIALFFIGSKR
ncbi:MAG: DegV family protein [Clostridiales bacterium]|jgi:DegV family protein with EDD domain|nr:DegV family protein [Clostridiales bacterium]